LMRAAPPNAWTIRTASPTAWKCAKAAPVTHARGIPIPTPLASVHTARYTPICGPRPTRGTNICLPPTKNVAK